MDPISAAIGFGADIFNGFMSGANNKRMMEFQSSENQKNRDFNERMMDKSNQWNLDQWNRENQYNLPANQIKRMQAAGLNPDLMYSGVGSMPSASSMPSSSASSSGGVSPVAAASLNLDNSMKAAQVDLLKAQAKKTESETEGQTYTNSILESDAKFRDAINTGVVETSRVTVTNIKSDTFLKESTVSLQRKEMEQIDKNIEQIGHNIDLICANISNTDADTALKHEQAADVHVNRLIHEIDLAFKKPMIKAQLANLSALTGLTHAQTQDIVQCLVYKKLGMQADFSMKVAQEALYRKQGVRLDYENDDLRVSYDARHSDAISEYLIKLSRGLGEVVGGLVPDLVHVSAKL